MLKAVVAIVTLVSAGTALQSAAESVHVVRRLDGYACMMLNQTPEEAIDPKSTVRVYARPSRSAPVVGVAMPVVAVRLPLEPVGGFLPGLFPNGTEVWIPAASLVPYKSLARPNTKCVPALMSNGLQGFDYFH